MLVKQILYTMSINKNLLFFLLLITQTVLLFTEEVKINLDSWNLNTIFIDSELHLSNVQDYNKSIKEANVNIPEAYTDKMLYLVINRHRGFSKIYVNGKYIDYAGSEKKIRSTKYSKEIITIPPGSRAKDITIKIINFSRIDSKEPSYYLKSSKQSSGFNYENLSKTLVSAQLLLVLLYLFSFSLFKDRLLKEDKNYEKLHLIFIFYLTISLLKNFNLFRELLDPITIPYLIISWFYFIQHYLHYIGIWKTKRFSVIGFIISTTILSAYILHQYSTILPNINYINSISLLIINILAARLILPTKVKGENYLKNGIKINILLTLIYNILLVALNKKYSIFLEIGATTVIVTYNLNIRSNIYTKIKSSEQYNLKLLDSIEKGKRSLIKKEGEISELKSLNEEIQREKTLFFTALSKNLRTPLNSIIGYSENLYSSTDISEIHSTVTDIIVESDRIYQIINNIMDFSTRNFSDSDLLLKDFSLEDIFNTTLSESPNITSFSKYINYRAIGNCDKVKITANPLIFKQVITSLLHFLIELNPKKIDYTIFDSGFDNNFINLELKLSAKNLRKSELSFISTISNYKDTFIKYINLYNVDFEEEMGDDFYSIHLKLRCELAKQSPKKAQKEQSTNLVLSQELNVMVVEDYEPNLNIVKMHLEKMGCSVITATNGIEAVEKFKENLIDLILMDIKMPIMDGWEATEKIREQEKGLETYIIGLTASSLDLDIRHCFESGMDDVQVKPIRKKQLYAKLNSLDKLKPVIFPTIGSLRAELSISKLESEMLYKTSINQIDKQLEVLEVLISADDKNGVENEMPAIIHASLNINAFYYSRVLRNMFYTYKSQNIERAKELLKRLKEIADEAKEPYSELFRD